MFLSRHRSVLPVFLILILAATVAVAEPERVDNGAEPAEGLVTGRLVEQWRAGGEDDEIFFGRVSRVAVDGNGELMLLDSQLSEIQVYDQDGNHLRTVGREGDGPGEMRTPNDFLILADGTICVVQGFGGRLTKMDGEGIPTEDASFTPAFGSGQFSVLVRGLPAGDGMALAGFKMTFAGAVSEHTFFTSLCDANGSELKTLHEKTHTIDYSDFVMTEMGIDYVYSRMATSPEGRTYIVPEFNGYEVHVWNSEGEVEGVWTREYEPLRRNAEQSNVALKIIEAVGAYYPTPPRKYVTEENHPDITGMWAMPDGTLWVQTSRGDTDPPEGCWTVLDVFDDAGRFVRQVAITGDHDVLRDSLQILPDGRFLVVVGALDAFLTQQAVGGEDDGEEAEEADPLEIICYTLEM